MSAFRWLRLKVNLWRARQSWRKDLAAQHAIVQSWDER